MSNIEVGCVVEPYERTNSISSGVTSPYCTMKWDERKHQMAIGWKTRRTAISAASKHHIVSPNITIHNCRCNSSKKKKIYHDISAVDKTMDKCAQTRRPCIGFGSEIDIKQDEREHWRQTSDDPEKSPDRKPRNPTIWTSLPIYPMHSHQSLFACSRIIMRVRGDWSVHQLAEALPETLASRNDRD